MKDKLNELLNQKFDVEKIKPYLSERSAGRVAENFIQLFEDVRGMR